MYAVSTASLVSLNKIYNQTVREDDIRVIILHKFRLPID
jgi:hypothetical protein